MMESNDRHQDHHETQSNGTPPPPPTYIPGDHDQHLGGGMNNEPAMGIGTAILNHEMLMDSQKMDIDDFNVFAEFNEFNEFKESIDFDDYNDRIRGNSNAKQIKVFPPPKPKKKG